MRWQQDRQPYSTSGLGTGGGTGSGTPMAADPVAAAPAAPIFPIFLSSLRVKRPDINSVMSLALLPMAAMPTTNKGRLVATLSFPLAGGMSCKATCAPPDYTTSDENRYSRPEPLEIAPQLLPVS